MQLPQRCEGLQPILDPGRELRKLNCKESEGRCADPKKHGNIFMHEHDRETLYVDYGHGGKVCVAVADGQVSESRVTKEKVWNVLAMEQKYLANEIRTNVKRPTVIFLEINGMQGVGIHLNAQRQKLVETSRPRTAASRRFKHLDESHRLRKVNVVVKKGHQLR